VKFYLDEHIPKGVAEGLRRRGIDVLTIQDAGRAGDPDRKQLAFAAMKRRVLVTFDDDFLALDAAWAPHSGIVFSKAGRRSVGELIESLVLIANVIEPEEMRESHRIYLNERRSRIVGARNQIDEGDCSRSNFFS
jgi:predicted nuclease of predicted toxin-antitoxin system